MTDNYFQLFIDAIEITTHMVLSFLHDVFKVFIVVVAAALPLFIVIVLCFGIIGITGTIIRAVRSKI